MKQATKTKIMCSLAVLSLASFLPAAQSLALAGPWGPERPTFSWETPAEYATFNSITDNPTLGDERNFVRIREMGATHYIDEVKLEPGKTYEVYSYFHNNAGPKIGTTAIGIADNVRMSANFPAKIKAGEKLSVNTIISADDTNPLSVWDGAYITADTDLYLRYVPGTATIINGGSLNGQGIGPDHLFSNEGALLGYNKFSGILPGCNEYAGYVVYQFKADQPAFSINKTVLDGKGVYTESIISENGKTVEFKVRYENTGTMTQTNVTLRDTMPEGLEYIVGSTALRNNADPSGAVVSDNIMTQGGLNIGDYGVNGWAEVTYRAKIKTDLACGKTLTNNVRVVTNDGEKEDSATVKTEACEGLPSELPQSGPAEIALAIIAIIGIGVGGTYWYRSRKALHLTEKSISGGELDEEK